MGFIFIIVMLYFKKLRKVYKKIKKRKNNKKKLRVESKAKTKKMGEKKKMVGRPGDTNFCSLL